MKRELFLSKLVIALLFFSFSFPSFAQDVEEKPKDAYAYSMQPRYRPKDSIEFKSYSFIDNCFVGGSFGRNSTFRYEYADGMDISLIFGKWIRACHGVRLQPGVSVGKDNFDGKNLISSSLYASYLFDFTHYLGGYDFYRFWDMSLVTGLGAAVVSYDSKNAFSWSAHLGLNFNFRIYGRMSLFVEPLFNFASNSHINSHDDNWRPFVPSLKTSVGVCYNFQNREFEPVKSGGRLYAFGSGGAIVHNSLVNKNGKFLSGVGVAVNAGVGFICKSWLSFRTALHLSNCLWDTDKEAGLRANTYAGVRAEAVFDVLPMVDSKYDDSLFGFAFFVGPEFGYMRKTDGDLIISSLYAGVSGGLQVKARIISGLHFLLEPRVSLVPYSAPTNLPAPQKYLERNYYDVLYSLSFGVQYAFGRLKN